MRLMKMLVYNWATISMVEMHINAPVLVHTANISTKP